MVLYNNTEIDALAIILCGLAFLAFLGICICFGYAAFALLFHRERLSNRERTIGIGISIAAFTVTAVGAVAVGCALFPLIGYEYRMTHGQGSTLQGDIELLDTQEEWHRGNFVGYTVKIKLDDTVLQPTNHFSEDMIEHFESNEILEIQYGEIKKEINIWEIKLVETVE